MNANPTVLIAVMMRSFTQQNQGSTMWSVLEPSVPQIEAFLAAQTHADYSYRVVGASRTAATEAEFRGYQSDHLRIRLGSGVDVFEAARHGLSSWQMFPQAWTTVYPKNTPLKEGTTVAVCARVFGGWWLNACRIVYVIDDAGPPRRFGFAYGTLAAHVETGEERFLVEWDDDDTVWYDLRAFSRPSHWFIRLGTPCVRHVQGCFRRDSAAAVRNAIAVRLQQQATGGVA